MKHHDKVGQVKVLNVGHLHNSRVENLRTKHAGHLLTNNAP